MSFSPSIAGLSGPLSALSDALTTSPESAFARLGSAFLTRLPAAPLSAPYVVGFSEDTAALLGLEPGLQNDPGFAELFSGNATREWPSEALPYASVYSGHQFGVWAGQLGDGRALGLGEVEHDGQRFELQLKGAGRTPYSRMGDGRAVLRSSIREYLCSEAMHHLGIPTTRALCVIGSDQPVRREEVETAAVVTRVAPSFVRFGHFEHFYSNDRVDALRALADHVIERFYPHCREADDPYLALLNEAVKSTADLMVEWQAVGFCHGVMNTDNMSILGLTIDYGPFGFMDGFDAGYICNHSDSQGRYAYKMQPQIAYWNLFCLAQGLLPLLGEQHEESVRGDKAIEDAQRVLGGFKDRFAPALERRMRAKLGLESERDGDDTLGQPPVRSDARQPCGFHADVPQSGAYFKTRCERRRAGARPVPRPRRVRCVGERLPRAPVRRNTRRRRARHCNEPCEPQIRTSQSSGGNGDPPREREGLFRSGTSGGRAAPSVRRATGT